MPELKPLDQICEPDIRHDGFVIKDNETSGFRDINIGDLHKEISGVILTGSPPEAVVNHFTIARNLYLYSWFVYDFTTPAQAHAYASVEFALRERHVAEGIPLPDKPPGIKRYLRSAIDNGWLKDRGYMHLFPQNQEYLADEEEGRTILDPEATEYCETLAQTIPTLRNTLAHGSSALLPPSAMLRSLEICAATINQLFPPGAPPTA